MYEDKIWFSQSLLNHRDKEFTKNGILDISINTNTEDYKTFSAAAINISINNDKIRKIQYLNYQNSNDLIIALEDVIKNQDKIYSAYSTSQKFEIIKKYTSDKTFRLVFSPSKLSGEKLCIISIINNESDFVRVAITYELVVTIKNLLKLFINDYINSSNNFINRCISTEVLNKTNEVKDSIKTLPSFFGSLNVSNTQLQETSTEGMNFDSNGVTDRINELDNFLGKDMSNITIPEIEKAMEKEKEKPLETNSEFITKFLRSDISVLENVITSTSLKKNPFLEMVENIKNELGEEILPEITNDDLKSISYISKKSYLEIFKKYTELGVNISSNIPVLKYDIKDITKIKEINKTISLDLFLILSYFKNLKDKLEMRESDGVRNKSLLYVGFRLFLDPLLFTFLPTMEPSIIKSLIKDKFNRYSKIGFFDKYTKVLESYNLEEITERQIMDFVDIMINMIPNNKNNVKDLHMIMFDLKNSKIPYDNILTLEQITNEVVPFEIKLLFQDKNQDTILDNTHEGLELSPDVKNYVLPPVALSSGTSVKKEFKSSLERATQFYKNEVPERHHEEFFNYIKTFKRDILEDFDTARLNFDVNELGDNVLKAIYIWNNGTKKESHNDFNSKIQDCIVDRNTIISNITNQKIEIDSTSIDDWAIALGN